MKEKFPKKFSKNKLRFFIFLIFLSFYTLLSFNSFGHGLKKNLRPGLLSLEQHELLCRLNSFHGDHAFFTAANLKWLAFHEIQREFHSKEESGKHPKKKRGAKRKARIRSKIEAVFGIMKENYHFGPTQVRGG